MFQAGLDDMSHLITMGLYYSRIVLCFQAGLDDQHMSHLITMGMQEETGLLDKDEAEAKPGKSSPTPADKNPWW